MRFVKKCTGLLLALVMAVTLLPATVLAGGTERFVTTYDELVAALEEAKTAGYLDIIVDGDGKDGAGFGWPEEPVELNIGFPQNSSKTFSVGSASFPGTMAKWVIPENVTMIQSGQINAAAPVEVNGTWKMQPGTGAMLAGSGDFTVNGTAELAGTLSCPITINKTASITDGLALRNCSMNLADGAVVENGQFSVFLYDTSLCGPAEGRAVLHSSFTVSSFGGADSKPENRFSGNLTIDGGERNEEVEIQTGTLICENGSMDLSTVRLEKDTTLQVAETAIVKARLNSTTFFGPPEGFVANENTKVELNGKLILGRQSEAYNIAVSENGVLDIPHDSYLIWCTDIATPRISGTGTVWLHAAKDTWGRDVYGSIRIGTDRDLNSQQFAQVIDITKDDSEQSLAERAKYIDSTITLKRDWVFDKPADDRYPIKSSVLDQNGQPVPGASIGVQYRGKPVDKVHYVEGEYEPYMVSVEGIPQNMRIRSVLVGGQNCTWDFFENAQAYLSSEDMVLFQEAKIEAVLEPVPAPLPVVTGLSVRYRKGQTDPNVTLNPEERLTLQAEFTVEGGTLPGGCGTSLWECSLDGVSWYALERGRAVGLSGSQCEYYTDSEMNSSAFFDPQKVPFAVRCTALPMEKYYTTGSAAVSEIFHINGSVSADNNRITQSEDIKVETAPSGGIVVEFPFRLTSRNGCYAAAAYDENGRMLDLGTQESWQAENGVSRISLNAKQPGSVKTFGLDENFNPICGAAETPAV